MRILRAAARGLLRVLMAGTGRRLASSELRHSAIVFSPHFDDESLGCGGTILRKRHAGADVRIVFMTDGSKSHKDFVAERDLIAMRSREGIAAAAALGVAQEDVARLGFEETRLTEHFPAAVEAATEILKRWQPSEVFVPYRREPLADHVATYEIVLAALRRIGREVTVYEYPIWCWQVWPWTPAEYRSPRRLRRIVKHILRSGLQLVCECRVRVRIREVLQEKREALQKHVSQMAKPNTEPRWPILPEVSGGEFLDRFFQDHEVFRASTVRDRRPAPEPRKKAAVTMY